MAGNKRRAKKIHHQRKNKNSKQKLTGNNVLVGYELGTGMPVLIEPHHIFIVGTTRKAGKTTAAEGIASRFPGVKVVAFTTKRGEDVFTDGFNSLPVFFKEPEPPLWRYLEKMFAATLDTKQMGIIRSTLIEFTKTSKTLEDAWRSVKQGLETGEFPDGRRITTFDRSMLVQIDAYFDIAMPQLRSIKYVDRLALKPGVNVMSLVGYRQEVQAMIIGAVCTEIEQHDQDTLTIIPEAWKFVPGGNKISAATAAIESLMRQGLVLRNYVMLDSQSLKVDTTIRQLCDNYLVGKLGRESNEVDRAMEVLEGFGIKPLDIKNQKVGQFFVLSNDVVKHTYVQPAWMSEEDAQAIARDYSVLPAIAMKYGIEISLGSEEIEISSSGAHVVLQRKYSGEPDQKLVKQLEDLQQLYDRAVKEKDILEEKVKEQTVILESTNASLNEARQELGKVAVFKSVLREFLSSDDISRGENESNSNSILTPAEPAQNNGQSRPTPTIKNAKTASEWVDLLWQEGFFEAEKSFGEVNDRIRENGFNFESSAIAHTLLDRVKMGRLSRKGKPRNYRYVQRVPYRG